MLGFRQLFPLSILPYGNELIVDWPRLDGAQEARDSTSDVRGTGQPTGRGSCLRKQPSSLHQDTR